jgi:predicted transcriptional regulator
MPRPLRSPRHEALRAFLVEKRKNAGLTQAEVAAKLGRYQSFVAHVESGSGGSTWSSFWTLLMLSASGRPTRSSVLQQQNEADAAPCVMKARARRNQRR